MVRIVRAPDGAVNVDPTGKKSGRGAYLCSQPACWQTALKRHALIHFRWTTERPQTPTWKRWFREAGLEPELAGTALMFSDETHAVQAAVAGQGIALLSRVLIAEELASGTLRRVGGPELEGARYRLVYLEERLRDERVAKVRRWILEEARRSG